MVKAIRGLLGAFHHAKCVEALDVRVQSGA